MITVPKNCKQFMPTYIIIALNVVIYVYTSVLSGNFIETGEQAVLLYGQVNALVLYYGYYWQLFTAMFVHANIVHLVGNMFFFLIFGLRAEEIFDLKEYLLIYFLSGLAGNLATLIYGPNMVSVGASGAIFGVFAACTIYLRRSFGQSIVGALIYAFFLLAVNAGTNVNILAHLGGLLIGLFLGYLFAMMRRSRPQALHSYTYTYSNRS